METILIRTVADSGEASTSGAITGPRCQPSARQQSTATSFRSNKTVRSTLTHSCLNSLFPHFQGAGAFILQNYTVIVKNLSTTGES
jgi:hypothetical protein